MKKTLPIIILILFSIIIFFSYRYYQDEKFKTEFRSSLEALPSEMRTKGLMLPPKAEKMFKTDLLVVYPNIYFYIDVQGYKNKTLPIQAQEQLKNKQGWICTSFFTAIQSFLSRYNNKHEQKLFFELIKTEKIRVEMKFRNTFGENLYTESEVLAQCPEYTKALYFIDNH